MNVTRGLLTVLSLVCHTESRCSPTSYYKNCWIRRFPGVYIDVEESQRRGAQLLKFYQEETALKCSRTCCLTRNFSCNLAIFHYDTTQGNCFHLHCPTLESCILSHRGNVVLYNITKGVDPDLLVFGKYFTSNVRVLPHHYGRVNASEPLPSDKRQFIHPPPSPPLTSAPTAPPSTSTSTTGAPRSTRQPSAAPTSPPASSSAAAARAATSPAATTGSYDAQKSSSTPSSPSPSSLEAGTTEPSTPASSAHHYATSGRLASVTESSQQHGGDAFEGPGPGWPAAARPLLVAVGVCAAVLLSCCCSALLLVSWRGQRRRVGRYRTAWRGKRGSMRLMKYVLVRENS